MQTARRLRSVLREVLFVEQFVRRTLGMSSAKVTVAVSSFGSFGLKQSVPKQQAALGGFAFGSPPAAPTTSSAPHSAAPHAFAFGNTAASAPALSSAASSFFAPSASCAVLTLSQHHRPLLLLLLCLRWNKSAHASCDCRTCCRKLRQSTTPILPPRGRFST